jgi:hypothetical protein
MRPALLYHLHPAVAWISLEPSIQERIGNDAASQGLRGFKILQVLLECARSDHHTQREQGRERQYHKARVQAEWQRYIDHPGEHEKRQRGALGPVVDEGALASPAPSPKVSLPRGNHEWASQSPEQVCSVQNEWD